jgi:hypothetical protein
MWTLAQTLGFTAYIMGVPESGYEVRAPDVSLAHLVLTRAG